jgi:enoyl-CoA hydratase/carnithine racemase
VNKKLLLVKKKNNVCTLTLNRLEKQNSLSIEMIELLESNLRELAQDDAVRTVILRGAGDKAFCSGFDIGSLPISSKGNRNERLLVSFPIPIIAMLNGFAFGLGCELAICCDLRIGAEDIRMGMPPAKLGLVYQWTGLQRFIQSIGLQSSKEMFFTGRAYKGKRIKELGLVDYFVPRGKLEEFTYNLAEEIAGNAPLALKGTKKIMDMLLRTNQLDETQIKEACKRGRLLFWKSENHDLRGNSAEDESSRKDAKAQRFLKLYVTDLIFAVLK